MPPAVHIALTSTIEQTGLWCDTCTLPSVVHVHLWRDLFHLFSCGS